MDDETAPSCLSLKMISNLHPQSISVATIPEQKKQQTYKLPTEGYASLQPQSPVCKP